MIDCEYFNLCEQADKNVKYCMHCKNFQVRKIKFVGIDEWNRPIFKVLEKNYYISDLENLFPLDISEADIKVFYSNKKLSEVLTYHGATANCEPMGDKLKDLNYVII